jgi:hypothetical protein
VTLLAVCGDASTTTALALGRLWRSPDRLVLEADPSGGDVAAWLDVPEQPGVASAVSLAPTGSWPIIAQQVQTAGGVPVLVMPVRASEASIAARELAVRLVPTLSALDSVTVIADCGRCHPTTISPVVTQAALVAVSVRQPSSSPRAAAAHLDRVGELVDALTARALPVVVLVVGDVPYRPAEIADFLGRGCGDISVLSLADDAVGAGLLAGRDGLGKRFERTRLGRTTTAVAAELAVRLGSLRVGSGLVGL